MIIEQEKALAIQDLHDLYPLKVTRGLEYEPGDQELPWAVYASMQVKDDALHLAEAHDGNIITYTKPLGQEDTATEMLNWLRQAAQQQYLQWIAAGLREEDQPENVFSRLWLEEDIVPFVIRKQEGVHEQSPQEQVMNVISQFGENNIVHTQLNEKHEVQVSELVTLEDYQKITPPGDFTLLTELAQALQGKKLVFINATPQGGGVALMRHALIRLLRLLHVDAHWYVLQPKKEVFTITKAKFHNVLQAVASRETELTLEDKALYEAWMQENAAALEDVFKQADVIVIDDPQPAGLIPYIKQANPDVKVIYRSHIQIVGSLASQEGTPQHTTWSFLWDKIRDADYFVSHPMKVFIPSNVPDEKILYMPATTDPLDGLNKPLTQEQMSIYLKLFNYLLLQEKQTPLDEERPYIIQIARFDPSKGIPDVLEAYKKLRKMLEKQRKPIPQLVITGNSSIDDPDGMPVYNHIKKLLQSKSYKRLADDVKVVRLPHRDQMLNALLRGSRIALQLSVKEGFEVKVTEALMKGKPVIAYNAGGLPLQIQDGVTGYLVERGDTTLVAQHLYNLLTDEGAYQRMSEAACESAGKDYLTMPNAISWLYLAGQLVRGEKVEGNCQWVRALVREKCGK
ncbi:MAG: glycosyltransferase [Ktedonobacteraceae bacterium]